MQVPPAFTLTSGKSRRPAIAVVTGAAAVIAAGALSGCAARPLDRSGVIPSCPPGRVANYLSQEAQQCWYAASQGRWRTLSHELHYDVLVVQVEASSVDDSDEIAGRFVERHGGRFSEILIYVHPEPAEASARIRRVRWTGDTGFQRLEFSGPAGAGSARQAGLD